MHVPNGPPYLSPPLSDSTEHEFLIFHRNTMNLNHESKPKEYICKLVYYSDSTENRQSLQWKPEEQAPLRNSLRSKVVCFAQVSL